MKRLIFFAALALFFTNAFAGDPIDLKKDPPPSPYPMSVTPELAVSTTIDEYQLAVYFDQSVGDATITIQDGDNKVVYQETVDTDLTTSVFVASDAWNAGNYTLTISYGTTYLIGEFVME